MSFIELYTNARIQKAQKQITPKIFDFVDTVKSVDTIRVFGEEIKPISLKKEDAFDSIDFSDFVLN